MRPTIYLALTHDWELRGDGSGDIEQIQFAPMRRLRKIYAKFGVRTTVLPDLAQQLRYRALQDSFPELKPPADHWDEEVRTAFREGHDIQLHIHPQWSTGEFADGQWNLNGDWSILNYESETSRTILAGGKDYLERLLQTVDASYRCLAFRAGALAAAPSTHLFKSLVDLGIQLDVSIAAGVFVENHNVRLDYRNCEETFVPFYPVMDDARRVSRNREPIVCVPLNHFYGSRLAVTRQNVSLAASAVRRRRSQDPLINQSRERKHSTPASSPAELVYGKLIRPLLRPKHFVSDTGRLNYPLMIEMLTSIRRRALESGLAQLPIVLTNHPKDIRDYPAIERFVGEASKAEDIRFITLSEISEKLRSGEFSVKALG
jgi:hypothetical protein